MTPERLEELRQMVAKDDIIFADDGGVELIAEIDRLKRLEAELAEAKAVIEKLDKTEDGVLMVPGMTVYVPFGKRIEARDVMLCMETLDCEDHWTENTSGCFSTEAAAKAAAE